MKTLQNKDLRILRWSVVIYLLVFVPAGLSAQRVLLSKNVLEDTLVPKYGQNLRHYVHPVIGLGMMAGPSEQGADIQYGTSINLDLGVRYKLRLARYFATGCDLSYNFYSFKLRQNEEKILPDTIRHNAERLLFNNLTLGVFARVNIGRTGNYIGKFVDLGAYGETVFYSDHFFRDKNADGTVNRTHVSGLNYINDLQYGVYARCGISRYVITFKYRLSDLFKDSYPELPRWTFGFQMGLHKTN